MEAMLDQQSAILPIEIAWLIIGAFSTLWIAIGWWLGRNNTGLDNYMLAGRKVGLALASATAMATWVTSNTTMAAPQLALQLGIWGMIGYSLGSVGLLLFAPMAQRIRDLMPNAYTSGDFFRLRYGKPAWRIYLLISFAYGMGWLISLGMAGGVLINALSGIDYRIGMSVILSICVIYTLLGGLKAVIGTDFIQTVVILLGIIVLAWFAINEVGFERIHATVREQRPELLNLLLPAALMFLFNNLFFGVGEIFHSNVWWSRAFAFGPGVGFRAYILAGLLWFPIPIVAGFVALATPALGLNVPAADMVGPMIAAKLMGIGGAIIVFIVVFAALASSLDSLLAATADLITQDIYKGHLRPDADEAELRVAAKFVIIALGVVTWLLCMPRLTTLGELLFFMGAFVASTIWPILTGLYWKQVNPTGAAFAMLFGTAAGLIAYFQIGFYVAALVSTAVSMLIVLSSTYLRPHAYDWQRLNEAENA
ncbi:sodium:solute symporter family protein [Methylomonas sp. MgM2]